MAPGPQENIIAEDVSANSISPDSIIDGDSIVISGMSGMFPLSNDVQGFANNLYNKVNMVTNNPRYKYKHPELQQYCGIIPDLGPFDAHFFGVHYKLSMSMDSMSRKLMEHTYQAIYDAGMSIDHARDIKLGVFIGTCFSETEKACFYVAANRTGFGIMGCCKAMFANRISYWLDAKGPSMSLDAMCSSSVVALENAIEAIRRGECDAAIVGSANLCLHPQPSILYSRSIPLCPDGKTKTFDKNADGVARSEAINVLVLQKAKDAKRIYSEVCHARTRFEHSNEQMYGPSRPVASMRDFFNNFYEEANVIPSQIEYVEAFGTAIPVADKNELEAIGEVFCKNRSEPLLVGSVMSNMGYSEAASGISSIVKVCLGYHMGKLAANLHYENPRDDVLALSEGRMRVVSHHAPFRGTYTAVNNFSIGGLNGHVLLKGYNKKKDPLRYRCQIPYLVTISGRQESAVKHISDILKSQPIDSEAIALLHNIHERHIVGHMSRGFCIISSNEEGKTTVLAEQNDYYADIKRPLWFVYSGMGSQWAGMGAELMRIPIFAAAIERCQRVLRPKGVDIVHILTSSDKTIFDNILHSFVGIAAVQIGLTDVLRELGIVPDNIIGHSVGELGCGYADGCFTAEEMILAAYSRGLVSVQTPFIHGSMAAVGMGYTAISKICPPEIEVACHNSAESSTISGPSDVMKEFVSKLTEQGVFAKEVPCSNIAYHSRYIAEAGPKLKEYLSEVIKNPKLRSERWVSTSVPQDKWNQPEAMYSSAEYHTNNLLSSVLFEETARLIPQNAVVIEIAPHGLLQAILKRSLPSLCTNIPLTRRGHSDPVTFLFNAIGQSYMVGFNPKLQALYPKVEYPVSTGTPFLSHLVKWVHTEKWPLPMYSAANRVPAAQRSFIISTYDDELKYIEGNNIEGDITFPLSALLVLVWETLAMIIQKDQRQISVQFQDVKCYKDAVIHRDQLLKLSVTIQRGSGQFEVTQDNNTVLNGVINNIKSSVQDVPNNSNGSSTDTYELDLVNIYKMFYKRGYFYKNDFRSIQKANLNLTKALLLWKNNWVTFIDSMLQLNILSRDCKGVSKPTFIKRLTIDTLKHQVFMDNATESVNLNATVNELKNLTRCGGVTVEGILWVDNPPMYSQITVLKKRDFMPLFPKGCINLDLVLSAYFQILADNINCSIIKAIEIENTKHISYIGDILKNKSMEYVGPKVNCSRMSEEKLLSNEDSEQLHLIMGYNLFNNENIYKTMIKIPHKTYLLSIDDVSVLKTDRKDRPYYKIVSSANTVHGQISLSHWRSVQEDHNTCCLSVENESALLNYTRGSLMPKDRLIVMTKYPCENGLKDLIRKWRKEPERNNIQLIMMDQKFLTDENFHEVTERDLSFNVFKDGIWGEEFYSSIEKHQVMSQDVKLTNIVGNLSTLNWSEVPSTRSNRVHVKVHYAGPTSYDYEKATDKLPLEGNVQFPSYGMDFSGITEVGQKVMGVVREGALGTSVEADPELLWPVPEHWTLEDAATVPQPYLLAFYCLVIKGKLAFGSDLLVHGGAGALGQAVIAIALSRNCNVFSTVSSVQKKKFLLQLFPELKEDNIGNSRDTSFEAMVQVGTNGNGCSLVVNCLKGPLKEVSMRCVGSCGLFIDINLKNVNNNDSFKFHFLSWDRSYVTVVLSRFFKGPQSNEDKKVLQHLMTEGIVSGYVRPLTRVTYEPNDAIRAFRLLAGSGHRGRVLLRLQHLSTLTATPRILCSPEKTFIVLCGKNEFGIDVADRLVLRGARNLMIHCEANLNGGYLQKSIDSWQKIGVNVATTCENICINNNHIKILSESKKMGQVEGIFIIDQYQKPVLEVFDKASREMCPEIKYFAILRINSENYDSRGGNILTDRNQNGLPIHLIHFPSLQQFDDSERNIEDSVRSNTSMVFQTAYNALDCLEIALRKQYKDPIFTFEIKNYNIDIIKDIAVIAGVSIMDKLTVNTQLRDFVTDIDTFEQISVYLEKTLKMPFNRDKIPDFTISMLKNFQHKINNENDKQNEIKGLSKVLTYVDHEEIDYSTDMLLMSTLTHTSTQRDDEFDGSENYLIIIPGLDGHPAKFQQLCERLKLPALVLQPPLEQPNESVQDIAQRFVKTMKKNLELEGKKFYILGHSFGVLIAMEMASLLEDQGYEGTVFCLDSSPDVFPLQLETVIGDMNEQQLQDAIIEHLFSLMTQEPVEVLTLDLREAKTWRDKVDTCMRHLCGRVQHSAQYARLLIEAAYGRICSARRYNSGRLLSQPLSSQIILMRGRVPSDQNTYANDFGLAQYSRRAPIVYQIDTDQKDAPQDLRCSSIINRHLDADILKVFDKRNLCDTYLLSGTKFMDA